MKEDRQVDNMFNFEASEPVEFDGGLLFRATKKKFGALNKLAIQGLRLKAGAVREPHVHPNAEQLDYCIEGNARVGIVGPEGERHSLDLGPGDISFVPQGYLHWIENVGEDELRFLVVLSHEEPLTIELSEMLAGVPRETLAKSLEVPIEALERMPEQRIMIAAGSVL
jgi:oxalate decarboxylase/phosphoglucose isomerase-like protein (cupin superfamily)